MTSGRRSMTVRSGSMAVDIRSMTVSSGSMIIEMFCWPQQSQLHIGSRVRLAT